MRGAPFPSEGAGSFEGWGSAESSSAAECPRMEGPWRADRGGAVDVHCRDPVGGGLGDAQPAPADFHRTTGDGVESTADIPAGRVEGGARLFRMFPRVDELEERGVCPASRPEPVLGVGEDMVALPRLRDAVDHDAYPEFSYDLEEDERAEAVKCDLSGGVLGLGA